MGFTSKKNRKGSTGPMSDKAEKPFEFDQRKAAPSADKEPYNDAVHMASLGDLKDGEWGRDKIAGFIKSHADSIAAVIESHSTDDGSKVPEMNPKPTPAVVRKY